MLKEGHYPGDWLKGETETPQLFSREQITLVAGAGDVSTGTVLGRTTGDGKYAPLDTDATDGTQAAAGILLLDVTVETNGEVGAVAIVRAATINPDQLTWPVGISGGEIDAALVELKALGIVARTGA